ncbi:AAA family ATPase [Aurantimonas sp. Leaf443]|uniref:AAA family ATPase n=1 Tax=Aurantimonas sp. Leaf443 TaxID=1736378 RepID=UPI000700C6DE|nr:AAA family ATPase [Aurantimonas sp. Leaf443]KQT87157.1 hypothetical protein ASG48_17520 [Aurantimonas sp. Leaf443]
MRLSRLDLTRYGKFTGRCIDFGARPAEGADLHVVYGLNEAGKSTALNATLDLLFGIEHASKYNFLHAYPTMEVGAAIELGGALHELVRLKRKPGTASLFTRDLAPANEALIAGALSGLGREAYRTMFCLDDETLEEGGNAILQSRGDLGELLFSASAGLAHIGAALARSAEEADGLYRKRGRTTEIALLKGRLVELKARREAIDMAASRHSALVQEASRARAAYDAAMAERGRLAADLDRARRLVRAAPLAERWRAERARLAAFDSLPRPPEAWAREFPAVLEAQTRLTTRLEASEARRAELEAQIAGLSPDAAVLALGTEIRALREAMGSYIKTEADLPRRHAAAAELEDRLASILAGLGQPGHGEPETLLLPAEIAGTLRGFLEQRSGVETRAQSAERELTLAGEALAALRREAPQAGEETGPDEAALQALDATLQRLRRSSAAARWRLESEALPKAERRAREALRAVDGFEGTAADLAALALPDARRLDDWRRRLTELERQRAAHAGKAAEARSRHAEAAARLAALRRSAGALSDEEAAQVRAARNAAWHRHRARLDGESAEAFAEALAADDRIAETRLARLRDLEELRQLSISVEGAEAALGAETGRLSEIEAERRALEAEIAARAPFAPAAAGEGRGEDLLEALAHLAERRARALEYGAALEETRERMAQAETEIGRDLEDLSAALARCAPSAASGMAQAQALPALERLTEEAEAVLAHRRSERDAAKTSARRLAEAEAALARRRRERHEAESALARWQEAFAAALAGRWIDAALPVGAVREILDRLGDLAAVLGQRDEMRHRIETMEGDQRRLRAALGDLRHRLGEGADTRAEAGEGSPVGPLADLAARLERAEAEAARLAERRAELERENAAERSLREEARAVEAAGGRMRAFFGAGTLAEVGAALERAQERARLEARLAETGEALAAALQAPEPEAAMAMLEGVDVEETTRAAQELAARHEDLDGATRERFAEMTRAGDALASIGGDDAVARLQVERQTVLLQIEEAAMRHLRLRAGTLLAEEALRRYRDRHRSTMMGRASEAFASMTRGAYGGLSARPEKDRETLIGLAADGTAKLATDMSKGTRFQLYLALRLAGYEEFAATRPPVPFLADDIMETFDEPRSQEVLRLLAQMARTGQVVYFTHHRHLCDMAREVEPGVRIHEL